MPRLPRSQTPLTPQEVCLLGSSVHWGFSWSRCPFAGLMMRVLLTRNDGNPSQWKSLAFSILPRIVLDPDRGMILTEPAEHILSRVRPGSRNLRHYAFRQIVDRMRKVHLTIPLTPQQELFALALQAAADHAAGIKPFDRQAYHALAEITPNGDPQYADLVRNVFPTYPPES